MIVGIVIWGILIGAFVILEVLGYIDGKDGLPTASQLIKKWRRQSWVNRAILIAVIALVGPLAYAHLVAEWF